MNFDGLLLTQGLEGEINLVQNVNQHDDRVYNSQNPVNVSILLLIEGLKMRAESPKHTHL